MAIRFARSADKHEIPNEDALHAMLNAVGSEEVIGRPGETTIAFVGHPHPQTDRYIEVIAAHTGADFVVFHVMPLSDLYRHLVEERK